MDQWGDPSRKRVSDGRVPEYLIITTNVRLTSVAQRGGIDQARTLLAGYAERLGLHGWDLWDANKLSALLDAYPEVALRFAEFVTPGQVLARAIDTIDDVNAALAGTRFTVGQGQPGCVRPFQQAHRAAGGVAVLGEPCSEVYDDGPGWVQHFTGPPGDSQGGHGLGGRSSAPGSASPRSRSPPCCGTPSARPAVQASWRRSAIPSSPPTCRPLLSTDAAEVLLDGGDWHAGRLVRDPKHGWRWKPQQAFSFEVGTRDWHTPGDPMDLRLRCAATMCWADVTDLAIDGAGRRRLRTALREGPLTAVTAALAARFSLAAATGWERAPETEGYNDRRFASYRLLYAGVQGRPALGVWARFQLPNGRRDTIVGMIDVRVDFTALPGHVTDPGAVVVPSDHRLDTTDLCRCLAAAWLAATQALPLAATADPFAVAPAGPSRVEVHLATERPWASPPSGRVVGLLDMLDLTAWGTPPAQPRPWMSTTLTTPLDLTPAAVDDLIGRTLRHLASGFGSSNPMTTDPAGRLSVRLAVPRSIGWRGTAIQRFSVGSPGGRPAASRS